MRIEDELRRSLREAADAATFAEPTSARPQALVVAPERLVRRRHPAVLLAAALAVLVAGAGALWAVQRPDPAVTSCAAVLVADGRTYVAWGDLVSVPRAERAVGTGIVPACSDTSRASDGAPARTLQLYQVLDVDASQAVLAEGQVWIADNSEVPASLRALTAPVPCRVRGSATVTGTINGIDPQAVPTAPPFGLTLVADSGAGLPWQSFASLALDVAVTSETSLRDGQDTVGTALSTGQRVRAVVTCDGAKFRAQELALAM
jgi:hypothetical protein